MVRGRGMEIILRDVRGLFRCFHGICKDRFFGKYRRGFEGSLFFVMDYFGFGLLYYHCLAIIHLVIGWNIMRGMGYRNLIVSVIVEDFVDYVGEVRGRVRVKVMLRN
jgi:hypothetical protein